MIFSTLVPLVLKSVALIAEPDSIPALNVQLSEENSVEMIAPVDTLKLDSGVLEIFDVLGHEGGSRRILISKNNDGIPVEVLDGGSWGEEGILDRIVVTNRRNDSMTAWLKVYDASPTVDPAPEGGYLVEFNDRIDMIVLNHDTTEQESFTLRDNQVIYKLDGSGHLQIVSVRPRSKDIHGLTRYLNIYDYASDTIDEPLTAVELAELLSRLFPVPGKTPQSSQP